MHGGMRRPHNALPFEGRQVGGADHVVTIAPACSLCLCQVHDLGREAGAGDDRKAEPRVVQLRYPARGVAVQRGLRERSRGYADVRLGGRHCRGHCSQIESARSNGSFRRGLALLGRQKFSADELPMVFELRLEKVEVEHDEHDVRMVQWFLARGISDPVGVYSSRPRREGEEF